jgi:hypothetical protein
MARPRKPKRSAKKTKPKKVARKTAKKAARPAPKAKAKRKVKALVKAPRIKKGGQKRPKPAARKTKKPIGKPRVKFVKPARDPDTEMKVRSLIARVYRQAAEEMGAIEQQAIDAKTNMNRAAADELNALAAKFEKH